MARQSFTLREDTLGGGSYLQYYPSGVSASAAAASATYLRGDDVQISAASDVLKGLFYFDVYASDYGEVTLDWNIQLSDPGSLPAPYEVIISYSRVGHPATIPEGQTLLVTRNVKTIIHKNIEDLWAYYTFFVRYKSNSDDDYYEPVAYRSALLPRQYGSTDALYAHIPTWYQSLDERAGGDLYKYFSIFGWDVDYMRTVLDYMVSMKDPKIAEVSQLNMLAKDLGIDLEAHELGADRLRKLLDRIGLIRRSKGTVNAIQEELSAITGCDVLIDQETKEIRVYNQRCNLVQDPRVKNGVQTGLNGGAPYSESTLVFDVGSPDTGWVEDDEEYDPDEVENYSGVEVLGNSSWVPPFKEGDIPSAVSFDYVEGYLFDGGGPSSTLFVPILGSNQNWIGYPDPETGEYGILETLNANVYVRAGDIFYFSLQAYDTDIRVIDAIRSVGFYTFGGFSEGEFITKTETTIEINGIKYWKIVIPDDFLIDEEGTPTYELAVLTIEFDPVGNDSSLFFENFTNILLERNNIGEYFDGNTKIGGWLVDEQNSISDFRWRNPFYPDTPFKEGSFSVYSPNYQKTKAVVQRLLPSILPASELVTSGVVYSNRPVTENLKYTIRYDMIPGFETI